MSSFRVSSGSTATSAFEQQSEIHKAMSQCACSWNQMKQPEVIKRELWEQRRVYVESCLSAGAFSQTFQVQVEGRTSPYCMKMAREEHYNTLFDKEVQHLRLFEKLDPVHTVKLHNSFVYKLGEGVERAVLIEKYGGEALARKYVKSHKIEVPSSHIGHIAAQMVVFLRALEKEEKVLGDITSNNIVVGPDPSAIGSLKFIDVAEVYEEEAWVTGCYRTTRPYRSPMVLTGQAHRSERSFPMGCVLFEIVTGEVLFDTHVRTKELEIPNQSKADQYKRVEMHLAAVHQIVPMTAAFKHGLSPKVIDQLFVNQDLEDFRLKSEPELPPISLKDRVMKALEARPHRLVYQGDLPQDILVESFVELLQRLLDYMNPPCIEEIMQLPFFSKVFHKELEIHLRADDERRAIISL